MEFTVVTLFNYKIDEKIIISEDGYQSPRVRDGKVVWESSTADGEIYINVFDIESRKNTILDMKLRWSSEPIIYENMVLFQAPTDPLSDSTSSMDIWLVYL